MTRLPSSVRVGPFRYKTRWVAPEDAFKGGDGACHFKTHHIDITTGGAPLLMKDTLLHEVLHAAWDLAFPAQAGTWDRYEERFIKNISPILLGILRDNPALVRYLTEALPK